MRKKAWFFKNRTVLGILGVVLVFGMLATGCPTEEIKPTYTVIFDADGGSAVASQTVEEGGKVTKPADPTKAGHTFAGWYKDTAKTFPWDFAADVVTANTTIYAKWVAGYTVTFDADGGSAVVSQTVEEGGKVTKPADPTKAGHTFAGWYKEAGKTNLWNFDTDVVTSNTTIYAKWVAGYTVTFNADGGSAVVSQTVEEGGKVTKPADPTKAGYTFDGWYNGATEWNFTTDTVTRAITLTAHWKEAVTITISFSGFSDEEIDLSHDEDQTLSQSSWDSLTVSLSGVESYDSIEWYVDGEKRWDYDEEYYLYASGFNLGPHTLSALVVKDSVPYSKTLKFQVSK